MTQNKDDVLEVYEKIAAWMDQHRSRILFEKSYLDRTIAYLKPGAAILDLGCGTGEPIGQYFVKAGFQVTGVDGSPKMLEIAQVHCPKMTLVLSDMRNLELNENFDCIIAWHSFFHLPPDAQRAMFKIFASHLKKDGVLLFTTGPEAGEIWSHNGGEDLYHASLSVEEYKELLQSHGFTLIEHKVSDPACENATVWLSTLQ